MVHTKGMISVSLSIETHCAVTTQQQEQDSGVGIGLFFLTTMVWTRGIGVLSSLTPRLCLTHLVFLCLSRSMHTFLSKTIWWGQVASVSCPVLHLVCVSLSLTVSLFFILSPLWHCAPTVHQQHSSVQDSGPHCFHTPTKK